MVEKVLIPRHFAEELQSRTAGVPVELVPYDKNGRSDPPSVGAAAIFRWWLTLEEGDEVIEREPSLRWIHSGSAGIDHILTEKFRTSSIVLTNSSGVHAPSIAEWVLASMLYFEKDLKRMIEQQEQRVFEKVERDELSSKKVVILGGGHIASAIAKLLRPFGCRLVCVRKSTAAHPLFHESVPVSALQQVVADCDWLILAVPLSGATRRVVDSSVLGSMPARARIINVARGEIVDEKALIEALRSGTIAGAALDVFEEEPLSVESPLWSLDNVLILPHTSWRSPLVKERQLDLFVRNLERFVRGDELLNCVDVQRGY